MEQSHEISVSVAILPTTTTGPPGCCSFSTKRISGTLLAMSFRHEAPRLGGFFCSLCLTGQCATPERGNPKVIFEILATIYLGVGRRHYNATHTHMHQQPLWVPTEHGQGQGCGGTLIRATGSMAKTSFDSQIVNHELNWTSTQAPTNWGLTYGCPQHIASSLDTPEKELTVSCRWACYYYQEDPSPESRCTERQALSPPCVRTVIVCVNFAIPRVACAYVAAFTGKAFYLGHTAHNGAVSGRVQ